MKHNHRPKRIGLPLALAALLWAALFLALPPASAQGTLILEEEFDYGDTAGRLVDVSDGNWTAHSGSSPYVQYVAAGLSMAGYSASGTGGAASFGSTQEDVSRKFTPPPAGDLYMAALVRISSATSGGGYFFHLKNTSTNFAARVFAHLSGGKLQFGFGNESEVALSAPTFDLDTTYLLVVRYNVETADAALYVLDAYAPTEPAAPLLADTGTPIAIDAVAIRQGTGGPTGIIDGIRLATTWQDAVGRGLLVSKAAPSLVIPGQLFTYVITATNGTGGALTGVVITDTVPANATFVSATDGGALNGGVVEWSVADPLAPGALVVRSFQVTATGTNGVQIVNDDYGADAGNWGTPAAGSPVTTDVFQEIPTDIQVIKSGPSAAIPGETLLYTLVISNTSTEDAANVVLTDTLPANTGYVSDDIGAAANPSPGVYAWDLGDLPAGTGRTYHVTVAVDAATPPATVLTNQAEVKTTDESDLADNSSQCATTVYELLTIAAARQRTGETVMIEGTVTAEPGILIDYDTNRKLYMEDGTAGIVVYRQEGLEPVARSNKVRVVGTIDAYRGETEIVPGSADDVVDLGPAAPVTPAEVATGAVDEPLEGTLVQVFGRIVGKQSSYQLEVDDGSGSVEVYRYFNLGQESDPHYIDLEPYQIGDHVQATGVTRGYEYGSVVHREILPRGPEDLKERYVVTFVYHDVEDVVYPGEDVVLAGDWNNWGVPNLDLMTPNDAHSVFTATVTLDTPGLYGYGYGVRSGGSDYGWLNSSARSVDVQGSPTVNDYRRVRVEGAWLLAPPALTVNLGEATDPITGSAFIPDVTDLPAEGRGVWAEVGYGTGTDLDTWTWTAMAYAESEEAGTYDEAYTAVLQPAASGIYSYTVRFDGNRGPGNPNAGWTYGDLDGNKESDPFELGQAGVLTVTGPSLSIAKDVQPVAGLALGGMITYTITLSNEGDGPAAGIVLTDTLPAALSFGGWLQQGDATEGGGTIQWTGDLAAGASVTIAFTATVGTDPALAGQAITNSASFTSANAGSGADDAACTLQSRFRIYLPLISFDRAP